MAGSFVCYGNSIRLIVESTGALLGSLNAPLPCYWEVSVGAGMQLEVNFGQPGMIWPLDGRVISGAVLPVEGATAVQIPLATNFPASVWCERGSASPTTVMSTSRIQLLAGQTRFQIPSSGTVETNGTLTKSPLTQLAPNSFTPFAHTWANSLSYWWTLRLTPPEIFSGGDATYVYFTKAVNSVRSPLWFYVSLTRADGLFDQYFIGDLAAAVPWNLPAFLFVSLAAELNSLYVGGQAGIYARQTEEGCATADPAFAAATVAGSANMAIYGKTFRSLDTHIPLEYLSGQTPGSPIAGMLARSTFNGAALASVASGGE
jgi:hypothetical protein